MARRSILNEGAEKQSARFFHRLARRANFNLAVMAKYFNLSERSMERHLKRAFGRSPHEWLMEQRLVAARRLLTESRCVKNVSITLGFKQDSHFCREFKRVYHMTPGHYLDLHFRHSGSLEMQGF